MHSPSPEAVSSRASARFVSIVRVPCAVNVDGADEQPVSTNNAQQQSFLHGPTLSAVGDTVDAANGAVLDHPPRDHILTTIDHKHPESTPIDLIENPRILPRAPLADRATCSCLGRSSIREHGDERANLALRSADQPLVCASEPWGTDRCNHCTAGRRHRDLSSPKPGAGLMDPVILDQGKGWL